LTRQRSEWEPSRRDTQLVAMLRANGCINVSVLYRRVHDGELRAIRSQDGPAQLWHLSVSHWRRSKIRDRAKRYPSWDELADARYDLLPANIDVVMHLPPPEQFVSAEDTTFHLHEHREAP
jgi:hypothetical protein